MAGTDEEDIEVDYEDDPAEIALREAIKLKEAFQGTHTDKDELISPKQAKKAKKAKKEKVKEIKAKKRT